MIVTSKLLKIKSTKLSRQDVSFLFKKIPFKYVNNFILVIEWCEFGVGMGSYDLRISILFGEVCCYLFDCVF